MQILLLVVLAVLSVVANASGTAVGLTPSLKQASDFTLLKTAPHGSKLYSVEVADGSTYGNYAPYLMDLLASDPYEAGFDAGVLMGKEYISNIESLFERLLGDKWYEPALRDVVYHFLDHQYKYLAEQLPEEYKKEFKGLTAGGESIGLKGFKHDVGKIAQRGLVLANFPGSSGDLKEVIRDEKEREIARGGKWDHLFEKAILKLLDSKEGKNLVGFSCSNFGVWGQRTEEGGLFTGRNLDWMTDTGVTKNKLITIHHPKDGHAHADVGFAGIWGALTGMSAAGLTVHEANLESNDETFFGFPWLLRLRHIMTHADDLASAQELWLSTGNTVGFNHGVGSAKDGKALLFETMAHNTAIFGSMDPREVAAEGGNPRTDAVFRTNHGFDPYTIAHYGWNDTSAYKNSIWRYNLFAETFDFYEATEQKIGALQAVNVTALLGQKGHDQEDAYKCDPENYSAGSNVLSATFHPESRTAYVAWESGSGADWVPASCNTYVEIDLSKFF